MDAGNTETVERKLIADQLLEYCKLDTLATVKVVDALQQKVAGLGVRDLFSVFSGHGWPAQIRCVSVLHGYSAYVLAILAAMSAKYVLNSDGSSTST